MINRLVHKTCAGKLTLLADGSCSEASVIATQVFTPPLNMNIKLYSKLNCQHFSSNQEKTVIECHVFLSSLFTLLRFISLQLKVNLSVCTDV